MAFDIELNLRADPREVKHSAHVLQHAIEEVFSKTSGSTDKSVVSLKNKMSNAYAEAIKLEEELDAIAQLEIPTQEYEELQRDLSEVEKSASSTQKALEKLTNTQKYRKLVSSIDETSRKLAIAEGELEKLKAKGLQPFELTDAQRQVNQYKMDLQDLQRDFEKMRDKMGVPRLESDMQKALDESERIKANMQEMEQQGTAYMSGEDTQEYADKAEQLAKVNNKMAVLLTTAKGVKTAFTALGSAIGGVARQSMLVFGESTRKGFGLLKRAIHGIDSEAKKARKTFWMFVKAMIGVRGLFMLFRKLRSAIMEGFNNLKQFNGETIKFKDTMDDFKASMTYMKNSIATAFAPLVTAVVPYLQQAAHAFAEFMTMVGAFFALLTGQSTMLVAKEQTDEYGHALDSAAGSAKKLNRELYGFDTLNRQQDNSGSGTDVSNMFEEVATESLVSENLRNLVESLKEFWATLKELWNNKDYFGIGKLIAQFFTDLLPDDWTEIYNAIEELATGIAQFINGLFDDPEKIAKIGKALAGILNSIIKAFSTFVQELDWDNIGEGAGEGVNGFFDELDLGELANGFDALVQGIYKALKKAAKTIKWSEVFSGIYDFFSNLSIDTITIIAGAIVVKGALKWVFGAGLLSKIATSLVSKLGSLLATGGTYALLLGQSLVSLLASALTKFWGLIKMSGSMLATAFADVGGAVLGGITGAIAAAIAGFWGGESLSKWLMKLGGDDNEAMYMTGWEIADELVSGFIEGDIWDAIGEWWSDVWEGITDIGFWEDLWDRFSTTASEKGTEIAGNIVEWWDNLVTWWESVWKGLVDWLNGLDEKARTWAHNVFDGFTSAEIWSQLSEWWETFWDLIITKVKKLFGINSPSTVFAEFGGYIIEGLKNGILDMWESVKDKVTAPFSWLKDKVKDIFDIDSPSKVFESYGRFIDLGFIRGIEDEQSAVEKAMTDMMDSVANQDATLSPNLNTDGLVINLDSAIARLAILADWFQSISNSLNSISSIPIPAVAVGGVIPPNAFGSSDSSRADNTLMEKIQTLLDRLDSDDRTVEVHAHLELDGREIYNSVVTQNNLQIQQSGRSRIRV